LVHLRGEMRESRTTRFRALLHQHLPAASRFARRLAGSADGEADLLAEAVATALVGFHRLRDDSRFNAWLLAIMRNRLAEHNSALRYQDPSSSVLSCTLMPWPLRGIGVHSCPQGSLSQV